MTLMAMVYKYISEDQETFFIRCITGFFGWIWGFLMFLPTQSQMLVPKIEPLTVQSLRSNSKPCALPLG